MVRWTSRDALLRIAVLCGVGVFYYTPLRFFKDATDVDNLATSSRVAELRLWLSFAATVIGALGAISTQLLVASCVHAALHVLQAIAQIPLRADQSSWCWSSNCLSTCVYDYGSLVSFLFVLRYVLLPSPSTLASQRRHRHQLRQFFQQHDRKYVGLVDRLLEDYTGNERLLFARIRKIYRSKLAATPLRTP